jgi:hypothetical protein
MNWDTAIKTVEPHVVRIETPNNYGTGFLAFYNYDRTWCGIATAAHVVSHADDWQQPIRIRNISNGTTRFLKAEDRVIFIDRSADSAVVLFPKHDLQLPESPIALIPADEPCGVGADIGWLGYPQIEPDVLCFFAGTVSAWRPAQKSYFIDGVAINGVSGGPVFHGSDSQNVRIIGSVSAYHPNLATGAALPGLARAQDVSQFHAAAAHVRSIDEATAKKLEFEEAQKQKKPEGEAIAAKPAPIPDGEASAVATSFFLRPL